MKRKLMIAVFILTLVAGGTFAQATAKATVELAISGTTIMGIRLSYTVEASSESDAIAQASRLYYAQHQIRAGAVIEAFSTVKWLNGPPSSSSSSPSSPAPSSSAVNVIGYSNVRTPNPSSTPTPQYEVASAMEVAGYYFNRGYASFNKRDYDAAIADYTEAIRLNPSYAITYYDRGKAYSGKEDYDRAIADYTEAIRLDPNYLYSYGYRAYAYMQKGNFTQARVDLNRVLQIEPNNTDAKNLDAELKQRGY